MALDTDTLIKEVAARHHIVLSEDDPILVTVTLNKVILSEYIKLIEDSHQKLLERLEETRQQENHHLAHIVENLRESLSQVILDLPGRVRQSTDSLIVELRNELDLNLREVRQLKNFSRRWEVLLIVSLVLSVAATVTAIIS